MDDDRRATPYHQDSPAAGSSDFDWDETVDSTSSEATGGSARSTIIWLAVLVVALAALAGWLLLQPGPPEGIIVSVNTELASVEVRDTQTGDISTAVLAPGLTVMAGDTVAYRTIDDQSVTTEEKIALLQESVRLATSDLVQVTKVLKVAGSTD